MSIVLSEKVSQLNNRNKTDDGNSINSRYLKVEYK